MIKNLVFKLKQCKESHKASSSIKLIPVRNKDHIYFLRIIYSTLRNNFKICIFTTYPPGFIRLIKFGRMKLGVASMKTRKCKILYSGRHDGREILA
jgi:hypothetical protein